MNIRPARVDDADAIAALYVQLKRHHVALAPDNPRYAMPDDDWSTYTRTALQDERKRTYVAQRGADVVGFVTLFFEEKSWGRSCEVETLVVDERARGRGVGRGLMTRVEELGREEGALGVRVNVLQTNAEGRRFYEDQGYRTIAVRYAKRL